VVGERERERWGVEWGEREEGIEIYFMLI